MPAATAPSSRLVRQKSERPRAIFAVLDPVRDDLGDAGQGVEVAGQVRELQAATEQNGRRERRMRDRVPTRLRGLVAQDAIGGDKDVRAGARGRLEVLE